MMKGSYDQRSRSLVSQEHVAERGVLNSVSESLRRVRQERGLTLEELAQRSGVSIGMLSQLERGVGNPSLRTLVKIAKGLGVPMGYFLSGISPEILQGLNLATSPSEIERIRFAVPVSSGRWK